MTLSKKAENIKLIDVLPIGEHSIIFRHLFSIYSIFVTQTHAVPSNYIAEKRAVGQQPADCSVVHNLTPESPFVVITSPGFPAPYPKLNSCHVIISVPFGKQLYLDFLHFDIEDSKQ